MYIERSRNDFEIADATGQDHGDPRRRSRDFRLIGSDCGGLRTKAFLRRGGSSATSRTPRLRAATGRGMLSVEEVLTRARSPPVDRHPSSLAVRRPTRPEVQLFSPSALAVRCSLVHSPGSLPPSGPDPSINQFRRRGNNSSPWPDDNRHLTAQLLALQPAARPAIIAGQGRGAGFRIAFFLITTLSAEGHSETKIVLLVRFCVTTGSSGSPLCAIIVRIFGNKLHVFES